MESPCPTCDGLGWLCDEHTEQPWNHEGCRAGGVPCCCNPGSVLQWRRIYCETARKPEEALH